MKNGVRMNVDPSSFTASGTQTTTHKNHTEEKQWARFTKTNTHKTVVQSYEQKGDKVTLGPVTTTRISTDETSAGLFLSETTKTTTENGKVIDSKTTQNLSAGGAAALGSIVARIEPIKELVVAYKKGEMNGTNFSLSLTKQFADISNATVSGMLNDLIASSKFFSDVALIQATTNILLHLGLTRWLISMKEKSGDPNCSYPRLVDLFLFR